MKGDINLLSRSKVEASVKTEFSNVLKLISLASIAVVLLLSFILFILARQLSIESIRTKQNAVIKNISFLKDKQVKLIVTNQKIEQISQILKKRAKFDSNLRIVYSKAAASGTSFQSLLLNKQKISISLVSSSLISIDNFLDSFIEMAKSKKLIQDFTIGSISLDPKSGNYSLNIEAQML